MRPASLPVPTPAKLLPISDVGHISWIPGTGEQTADIERSISPTEGFVLVAADFPTFKGSTFDLFCDTEANIGGNYYYRVRSRNTAGVAAYSNTVGPVPVAHRWLVDDLWDFGLMRSRSAGTVIEARYDLAAYHCDLAVLKAKEDGQNITYALSGAASYLRIIANNDTTTLTVEASTDGQNYRGLSLARTLYPPLHPEFTDHPRVLYEGEMPAKSEYRFVRINFGTGDVISRVEIASGGARDK